MFGRVDIGNVFSDNDYHNTRQAVEDNTGAYVYENKELRHVYSSMNVPRDSNEIRMDDELY